jgi:nitroreductase
VTANTRPHIATALRRAALRARLAPSVHNTQPWRMIMAHGVLTLHADWSRQLRVLDPTTRQLTISCGCALMNTRVSLASDGFEAEVERFPTDGDDRLLARVVVGEQSSSGPDAVLAPLDHVIELRRTNRRRFAEDPVPSELLTLIEHAAASEASRLKVVIDRDHLLALARLSQRADALELLNPAYRAELRAWTTDDPRRPDGVPAHAVPHVDDGSRDEIPIRDFDTHGMGWLPTQTASSRGQCLVLLGSDTDDPAGWLRAGEALERIWLELTRHGFTASPLTQVTEVPSARTRLREELSLGWYPHVLLRIGRAPTTPAVRRREIDDVLIEE